MAKRELAVLFLCLSSVALVYCWATKLIVFAIIRRIRRRPAPVRSKKLKWTNGIFLTLAGLGMCCLGYSLMIEPYWPQVDRFTVVSDKLPKGSQPIRIVHLSDLHCDSSPRLEERLPGIIRDLKPDLILFTGDSTNSPQGNAVFDRLMKELSSIAPLYGVRGNWDYAWIDDDNGPWLKRNGGHEVAGFPIEVKVRGQSIYLAGSGALSPKFMYAGLSHVPKDALCVAMYHYPDEIPRLAQTHQVDLELSGHTHGGQVALPFYGALVTLSKYGKRFEGGMYEVEKMHAHVSRGIGMEGHFAPRMRFFARPDVTLIEIVPR